MVLVNTRNMALQLLILSMVTVTVKTQITSTSVVGNTAGNLSIKEDISAEVATHIPNGSTTFSTTESHTPRNLDLQGDKTAATTIKPSLPNTTDTTVVSRNGPITTLQKEIGPNAGRPSNFCPKMPDVEGSDTLVKCKCKGNEILSDSNQCLPYAEDIYINEKYGTKPISRYKVVTKDIYCDADTHRLFNFTKGKFYYRSRGDIVLHQSAGELDGQRIHQFCIIHQLDNEGNLTWTMKGCVPHPAVPRCCPFGQAMKDGSCQPAKTPVLLTPPISAKTHGNSVEWPNITNFLSPLKCDVDPVKTYALSNSTFHLLSLASGLRHFWRLPGIVTMDRYEECPKFCVDGIVNGEETVDYFTSLCYSDVQDRHRQACADGACVRKCCPDSYIASPKGKIPECESHPKEPFNPPLTTNRSHFNTVYGWPFCSRNQWERVSEGMHIDESGSLFYNGIQYPPTDYCTDKFLIMGNISEEGYICRRETTWEKVRIVLFPIGNAVSFIFLVITIACHLLVPRMLQYGGSHQLCHAVCLAIAYLANFINLALTKYFYVESIPCFCLGIIMQFGYLGAFFWLNVMCFELYRTTRSLKSFMRDYKQIPTWCFMVYGWGGPVCISVITVLIDLLAPDNVPGLIKPGIGIEKCWFNGDWELLAYFYGHIATLFVFNIIFLVLTTLDHRQLIQKYKANIKYLQKEGKHGNVRAEGDGGKMPPKHIIDHVPEFTHKIRIFMVCAACWLTEVLSWQIPPPELWALTDILNTFQGLALFLILIGNRNKRKLLQRKFPKVFEITSQFVTTLTSIRGQLSGKEKDQSLEMHRDPDSSTLSNLALSVSSVSLSTICMQDTTLSASTHTLGNSTETVGPSSGTSEKEHGVH